MLHLPAHLPAIDTLRQESAAVCAFSYSEEMPAFPPNVRRILFLNLMPKKAETELDIARMLAGQCADVALLPMKIAKQTYKTTPIAHMETFYRDFEYYARGCYDGLIITGAPVEHLPFEEVRYWPQLCDIMDWATAHVRSTLYICWGAQAGLYHHYGVPKYPLPAKRFGIFQQRVLRPEAPLMRGLAPSFPLPNSRHTEVREADINAANLQLLAAGEESGVGVVQSVDGRRVFIVGHLEYGRATLQDEYQRDLAKGLPIAMPQHYYESDDASRGIHYSWLRAARLFYANWIDFCVSEVESRE